MQAKTRVFCGDDAASYSVSPSSSLDQAGMWQATRHPSGPNVGASEPGSVVGSIQRAHQANTTPESERALIRPIRILQAQQHDEGVIGLSGRIAGLTYDLQRKHKDRMRSQL
eukprot:1631587-Pleurochrysis_carterae.AAC.8